MPLLLTRDCPFCGTRSVAFRCVGKHLQPRIVDRPRELDLLLACGNCERAILACGKLSQGYLESIYNDADRGDRYGQLDEQLIEFTSLYPDSTIGGAPQHTPDRVANLFQQATSNLSNRNWDAAGAMARKTLDVATKVVARERVVENERDQVLGLWLKKRVERLAELGLLTADIAALAGMIKDGGDDASHDEDPYTEDEAERLIEFTEVLLTYVFTIPGMVEAARPPTGGDNG